MEAVIALVIAGVVAYFVYQDAIKWRDEEIAALGQSTVSAGLWAFGVLMFMIIFLPLYLILRSSAKGRLTRSCPRCMQRIGIRAQICPYCQHDVSTGMDTAQRVDVLRAPVVTIPPGWLPDPTGAHEFRYWDGRTWTTHTHDSPVEPTPSQVRA